jgi:transcription elongation factor GreB
MGRYRPPQQPGSKYITREGFERLQAELDYLWREKRPQVTQAVREAAAQGDRSENAEYIYGKKQLREIDSRVRFLRKRLDGMTVVDSRPSNPQQIFFGAWIEIEDSDGNSKRYRIVGPDEIDPEKGYISIDSPMAKALLKKQVGDDFMVMTPKGEEEFYVVAVQYEPFE